MNTGKTIARLLEVIEDDIAPKTRAGVARGNKIFGAAILRKADLSLVIAETNNEVENPLWHGEMHALKRLYERGRASLPAPRDCIFLATHEPCSLCLSAITWGGYDNFWYLFGHEATRDAFNIPHDLEILKEVFGLTPGGYRATNAYWTSHPIAAEVDALPGPERAPLKARIARIAALYGAFSAIYQGSKGEAGIPLD
ncbi:MAG: nucleoside deaminase [Cucumibacter sp.]